MTIEAAISAVNLAIEENADSSPAKIEQLLPIIFASGDSSVIGRILLAIRDDFAFDESIFQIIHGVERFDDSTYVDRLVPALPILYKQSPRWASILLIRIINNPNTRAAFVNRVANEAESDIQTIANAINGIKSKNTKLQNGIAETLHAIRFGGAGGVPTSDRTN